MGQIMRKENWPEKLNEFLSADHVFDWTTCNCVLFSANAVVAMTGTDFARPYRKIKTKRGMLAKIGREYGDVANAATAKLGEPIAPLMAKRGDVVAVEIEGNKALGICIGSMSVFVSETEGLIRIPTEKCLMAWTI